MAYPVDRRGVAMMRIRKAAAAGIGRDQLAQLRGVDCPVVLG
jgi:hypothetical protein